MKSVPISEMFLSWQSRPFCLAPPAGWLFTKPSAIRDGDGYLAVIRCKRSEGRRIETRNLFCRLGPALFGGGDYVVAAEFLAEPAGFPAFEGQYRGIEDIRLFRRGGALWGIGVTWHLTGGERPSMVLLQLRAAPPEIIGWRALASPGAGPPRPEKNWMPVEKDGTALFVYAVEPTILVSDQGALVAAVDFPPGATGLGQHLRGTSQLLPFGDGFLAMVHETAVLPTGARHYFHRFICFDSDLRAAALTERFHFVSLGIEFAVGLCPFVDPARLVVGYSLNDESAHFGSLMVTELCARLRWLV